MTDKYVFDELSEALISLKVSKVRADNEAIARLEKNYGKSVDQIVYDLENSKIISQALNDQHRTQLNLPDNLPGKIIIASIQGVFFGAVISIGTLIIRPQFLDTGFILGFLAASSFTFAYELESERKR